MYRSQNIIVAVLALAVLLPASGCSVGEVEPVKPVGLQPFLKEKPTRKKLDTPATAEQEAILAVLEESRTQFKAGFESITAESQPSAVTKMFGAYLEKMDKVDLKNCPLEFRGAWSRHMKAWKALHTKIGRLPDAFEDVSFMDSLNSLFRNESDKGKVLGGDVITCVKQVVTTYNELFNGLSNYNIEVN